MPFRRLATSSPLSVCLSFSSLYYQGSRRVTAHDATVTVVYPSGPEAPPAAVYHVNLQGLPMMSLSFVAEDKIIAGGHDSRPLLFTGSEQGWDQGTSIDDSSSSSKSRSVSSSGGPASASGPTVGVGSGRLNNEAFNLFRAADSRGVSSNSPSSPLVPSSTGGSSSSSGIGSAPLAGTRMTASGTELLSVHQNTIVSVRIAPLDPSRVHTAGSDGKLVEWSTSAGGVGGITRGIKRL